MGEQTDKLERKNEEKDSFEDFFFRRHLPSASGVNGNEESNQMTFPPGMSPPS